MAQNNLTVDQVGGPDFSGIAQLMTGAGASFNNAFDAANSVLSKYQAGQQAKADAGYLNAVGNIKNETELTDFFAKNPLAKANLSPDMMKTMLGLRDQVLGYEESRAQTDNTNATAANTRATTGINLAGEKRSLYDWQDKIAGIAAGRAAQPAITGAYIAAQTTGQGDPGTPGTGGPRVGPTLFAAAEKQYGLPAGFLETTAQIESGGNPNAKNPSSSAGGLFQQLDSNAKAYGVSNKFDPAQSTEGAAKFAADNANALRKVLGREPTGAELYLAHQQGGGGASALLRNPNAPAVDIVGADAVRLNGGDASMTAGEFANIWISKYNKLAGTPASSGATPGPNGFTGGAQNGYLASPQIQAGLQAIQSNKYLTASEAQAQVDALIGGAAAGQKTISERDAQTQLLLAAGAQNAAALNPAILTDAQRQAEMLKTPGLNAITAQTAAGGLNTLTGPGGALAAVATPPIVVDPATQAGIDAQNEADRIAADSSPGARKQDVLDKFTTSKDPVADLVEQANKTGGGGLFSGTTLNDDTRKAVQALADQAGVSVPQMAATLADITDPSTEQRGWGLNNRPSLDRLLQGVQDGGFGAIKNAINDPNGTQLQRILDTAKADAEAVGSNKVQTATNTQSAAKRASLQLQITNAQTSLAKVRQNDPNDPRIAGLEAQITTLKQSVFDDGSNIARSVAAISNLPPGSSQFKAEAKRLLDAIQNDSTLDPAQKRTATAAAKLKLGIP